MRTPQSICGSVSWGGGGSDGEGVILFKANAESLIRDRQTIWSQLKGLSQKSKTVSKLISSYAVM